MHIEAEDAFFPYVNYPYGRVRVLAERDGMDSYSQWSPDGAVEGPVKILEALDIAQQIAKGLRDRPRSASPHFSVRLFGADTLWEEGAHLCSCR